MPLRYLLALAFVLLLPRPGGATSPTQTDLIRPSRPLMTGTSMALASRSQMTLAPRLIMAKPLARGEALLLPVSSACISSPFGPRILPNRPEAGTYHYGIDLPAPEGAPVRATAPGQLIRVQHHGPGGLEMLVQHDGFVGVYSHLGAVSPTLLAGKTTIAAGEQLGVVGHTGVTFGMHLYFAMLLSGKPVDPAPYLGVGQCSGGVHRTKADLVDANGKLLPTRHYAGLN
jgi:murein DD-endopeptidase MepM/ murein hydrolase activator NlpD